MSISRQFNKAQTSMEFLAVLSLFLILFTTFYSTINFKQIQALKLVESLRAKTIADRIAYELDLTFSQYTNFTRNFELPLTILGKNYSIELHNSSSLTIVELKLDNNSYFAYSIVPEIRGEIRPGFNTLKSYGGVIYAN